MAAPSTHCIILARGGSKGVPGKNLKKIGGLSLVARSVRAGRAAQGVDVVAVSTDDAAIAAEAAAHGARVIDRPADLSGDGASSESGWLHAMDVLGPSERVVFLQCTSPFTTGADIDAVLARMEDTGAACALSVVEDHGFLWGVGEDGLGQGVNHAHLEPRKRRQDLPPQYLENGAIYAARSDDFRRVGRRFCGPVALAVVTHPPVEIDTPADLAMCQQLALARGAGADIGATRLAPIRAVVMDFDGVHTDNLVLTDETGREAVMTSRGDGMGLGMLREAGRWQLLILSKERNPVVLRRAEKLKIEVSAAVDDKVAWLEAWLGEQGLGWEQVLYVGNDLNDAGPMAKAGLSACPSDAVPEILGTADWVLPAPGGKGALRAMCDALLAVRAAAH